ncbi:hypothetical protein BT93_L0976 [Corymbia citriodora subsp. variegata]|uniref:NADH-ubiquinone oxidoreductase chain 4L n=1 Tax=Corymbia citriodora subsp. variegata TaxID=360336 RepID=A0A8T0CNV7_CORYI|nr:hypothetical protein BT93_L0976 [Corymbia citriodora subsp. variegata]
MILEHVLVLSAYLFSIGIYGLITSRNMVRALMCLELILNAVNINFVTFSDFFDSRQLKGDIFSIFVIAIAAAEAAKTITDPYKPLHEHLRYQKGINQTISIIKFSNLNNIQLRRK